MERTNLKVLRIKHKMTQAEFAEKIGCSRTMYAAIETGRRCGSDRFWYRLQAECEIPDTEMWGLKKCE